MNPLIKIRNLLSSDRELLSNSIQKTGFFSDEEHKIALELIDDALQKDNSDYHFGVAEVDSKVAGYACYGQRPLTESTYDLYWIVVDPDFQKHGIGKQLMSWSESQIHSAGGTLVIAETSGKKIYEPTRKFYLGIGYREEARIKDFYKKGDDMVIFTKRLGNSIYQ
ncbi:MAG: GNAT family N-acetyltransferase [Candidatus Riflebacteria bacterium]|nr:GNAT family N-acetyltransferase [Candidatus Riflebacteria bacterium]